ncbi:MAG: HipA N-terminal domain-containing protein [Bacteroidota bacterium]|nr:HipA N-terminal domain-containing protein [Bacteroidota bacterium]
MRKAAVYRNGTLAGILTEESRKHFVFRYEDSYFTDPTKAAISLTLPKSQQEYNSEFLFPFFSNMIAEGENKKVQSRMLKIDENDQFGLLASTATADTIGNITVKRIDNG